MKRGRVAAIAVKTAKGGPMREIEVAEAVVDGGITAGTPVSAKRGITFLSRERWNAAMDELMVDLPWHTRRANVLVEGLDLAPLIGRRVRLGDVEVDIRGETHPCARMDALYEGLRRALEPDCRGGVYGQVVRGGTFRVGDDLVVLDF